MMHPNEADEQLKRRSFVLENVVGGRLWLEDRRLEAAVEGIDELEDACGSKTDASKQLSK